MQRQIIAFLYIGCTVYPAISPLPFTGLPVSPPHSGFSLFSFSPTPDSQNFPSLHLRILVTNFPLPCSIFLPVSSVSFSPTPDSCYFPSPPLRILVIFLLPWSNSCQFPLFPPPPLRIPVIFLLPHSRFSLFSFSPGLIPASFFCFLSPTPYSRYFPSPTLRIHAIFPLPCSGLQLLFPFTN